MRLLQKIQARVDSNKGLLFICLAVILLIIFEKILHHNDLRFFLPQDVSDNCDCLCALSSRAWYLKINFAHALMLVAVPVMIFSINPKQNIWIRSLYVFGVLGLGYFFSEIR